MLERLRTPLILLAVLAVAGLAIWKLVLSPGSGEDPAVTVTDDGDRSGDGTGRDPGPGGPTLRPGRGALDPGDTPAVGPAVVDGVPRRAPEGIDLSDPDQLRGALREALAEDRIDWNRVAHLIEVYEGPLDDDIRKDLLHHLVLQDRSGALRALARSRDGTLTPELLRLLDEQDLSPRARTAVVDLLGKLRGANDAEVVLGLESRLTGNQRTDLPMLQAIGRRGGREAARAIVEYLTESENPITLPHNAYLGLDVVNDAEAANVLAAALASGVEPKVLQSLVRLAAQPGADGLVASLVELDQSGQPQAVRQDVFDALSRIGTESAVVHLLEASQQTGSYADVAVRSIGMISNATVEARARLVAALNDPAAQKNPRARLELLRAVGNLGEPAALESMLGALGDPDLQIQILAVRGIGNMRSVGAPHVERLLDVFGTGSESMQRTVAIALGGIGGDKARSALEQMLTNDALPPSVVKSANLAIQRMQFDESNDAGEGARLGGGDK